MTSNDEIKRTVWWTRNGSPQREWIIGLPPLPDGAAQSPAAYVAEAQRTKNPKPRANDPNGRYGWRVLAPDDQAENT